MVDCWSSCSRPVGKAGRHRVLNHCSFSRFRHKTPSRPSFRLSQMQAIICSLFESLKIGKHVCFCDLLLNTAFPKRYVAIETPMTHHVNLPSDLKGVRVQDHRHSSNSESYLVKYSLKTWGEQASIKAPHATLFSQREHLHLVSHWTDWVNYTLWDLGDAAASDSSCSHVRKDWW